MKLPNGYGSVSKINRKNLRKKYIASVLLIARLKDKPNIRIMAQNKLSLAAAGDAIGFELTEGNGFECIGAYDITVDELLSGKEGRGKKKIDEAISFITEYLRQCPKFLLIRLKKTQLVRELNYEVGIYIGKCGGVGEAGQED